MSAPWIRNLLEGRVSAFATTHNLQVAWENLPFNPPPRKTYLRAFLLPAATDSLDIQGEHRLYVGALQINVVALGGNGPGAAGELAELLAAHFPKNLALGTKPNVVRMITPMSVFQGIPDEERYTVPVSGNYRADIWL